MSSVNLAALLGIDPDQFSWQQLAACSGTEITSETDIFFDKYEQDTQIARAVDALCIGCPVLKLCLKTGIDGGETGVWGGIYLENGKHSQARNQHKTKEDWDKIRSVISD